MKELFFSDNFFSAGKTDIYNGQKEIVGELDLQSALSSSLQVLDAEGRKMVGGKFTFFGNKWIISNEESEELGYLKMNLSFFTKKYQYITNHRGNYSIESEMFSKQYDIYDEVKNIIATFHKVSGFFSTPAFQLLNHSHSLSSFELIGIVMGINAIQKANNGSG
ncbi:hypothetical protein [Rossellomorea aquimaris]|uniref:hypothetical protein n=1 Tax=Rossellomorea aquimaris TaxID=189382 RepID=UPI0007D09E72|nr:hypothetical protein [Rossellomorea aquimaris]